MTPVEITADEHQRLAELNRTHDELLERFTSADQHYALAIVDASDGLWDWKVQTGELWWSKRFMQMLGLDRNSFSSTFSDFSRRLHPNDRAATLAALAAHAKDRRPYDARFRLRHSTGRGLWIRSKGQGRWNGDGHCVRIVGTVTDISAHMEANRALAYKKDELQRVNEELERFTAVASQRHESSPAKDPYVLRADHRTRLGHDEKSVDYLRRARRPQTACTRWCTTSWKSREFPVRADRDIAST